MQTPYFQAALKTEFSRRVAKNSSYSLRSFARHLGISASSLSRAMAGQRGLSTATAARVCSAINLTPGETNLFLASLGKRPASGQWFPADGKLMDEDHFIASAEWYHQALLELTFFRDIEADRALISRELGLPEQTVQLAIERLLRTGLLTRVRGRLKKCAAVLWTRPSGDYALRIMRQNHRQAFEAIASRIAETGDEKRITAAMTIAVDRDKLELARKRIEQFALELAREVSGGELNDVYQLTIGYQSLLNQESKS